MKKAGIAFALGAAVALTLAVAAVAKTSGSTATAASAAPTAQQAVACRGTSIGIMAPLTGPAAFLGQEQLSWSRFALQNYNNQNKTKFKIVQGDSQLSASLARTVGRQFVSNRNIMAVIGGSTSQSVISSAGLFKTARLAAVSPSATRVDLTNGQFPTFFRVIPNDAAQARSIVNFTVGTLKVTKVVLIDSQDDYSTALVSGMVPIFRSRGVNVSTESVSATTTDFSTIATRVASDVNIVVFATQTASAAQALSDQLLAQGKRAIVLGTDGAFSPSEFKPRNGYVSSFAPDIKSVKTSAGLVRAYNRFSKNKVFGTFGPPAYMATWVALTAMNTACRDGKSSRAEVTANVKRTNLPSILGGTIRFTDKGDLRNPKWFMFKITNGKYTSVG